MKAILHHTEHRPWPVPDTLWRYYQEWNHAIFLHWKVDYDALRKLVPGELEIDCFGEQAWVSLVLFRMEKIRPRFLPALSFLSNFDEINLRTYVKFKGKAGVHFLKIEAGNKLSCELAKALSGLPYEFETIERSDVCNPIHYIKSKHISLEASITKDELIKTDLDIWLTERYALFQHTAKGINAYDIHHLEWPIEKIQLTHLDLHYPEYPSLLSGNPDCMHYSSGVQVLAWAKQQDPFVFTQV